MSELSARHAAGLGIIQERETGGGDGNAELTPDAESLAQRDTEA